MSAATPSNSQLAACALRQNRARSLDGRAIERGRGRIADERRDERHDRSGGARDTARDRCGQGGAYRRADGQRQVGARAGAGRDNAAASSSIRIPCRFIAICASSPRARRRTTRRAFRTASTAIATRRSTARSGTWLERCGGRTRRGARAGQAADLHRRHRSLLQGAAARPFQRAAGAGRRPRGGARAARARRHRGAACRACAARSGRWANG